jgi:hypothetical protein
MQRPPEEELETIRLMIETTKLVVVSDEVREAVERYLPDLRMKLPPQSKVPANKDGKSHLEESQAPSGTSSLKEWSATELVDLANGLAKGESVEDIANYLRRDVNEVRVKGDALRSIGQQTAELS